MSVSINLRRLWLICWLLVACLCLATAGAFLGEQAWLFELCSHFRMQYLVAAVLLLPLCLIAGFRWGLLAPVAVIGANLVVVLPYYLMPAQAASLAGNALKVMSINVYQGNKQFSRVLEEVKREKPDVLVLLETDEIWRKHIDELGKRYPYRWMNLRGGYAGIAILSREMPVETRLLDFSGKGIPSPLITLERGKRRISVLGTHLHTPSVPGTLQVRNRELANLARVAREHPWPLLIVGDFNVTPFSPYFSRLLKGGGLESCARAGIAPTWPARLPPLWIQIDHCLSTPGIETRNFKVGNYVGSDHYPISVRVGFSQ